MLKRLPITESLFEGAISLEPLEGGLKPWRIPYEDFELYPPNGIEMKAAICAGVRLRFRTDSPVTIVRFAPIEEATWMDALVDGELYVTVELEKGDTEAVFPGMAGTEKELDIFLPQNIGMTITGLEIDSGSSFTQTPDRRPRWLTYGSSITQCVAAQSPSLTWPAIAAREGGMYLTCLGYSGNCHMEPMVAKLIRDTEADVISLCVGINVYGAHSLSPRTFKALLIGMLVTIREKHRETPLLVMSPIYAPERETNENKLGFTLTAMREDIRSTVEMLQRRGDRHLYYLSGLELFDAADAHYLPDGLHPDAEGYRLLGERFVERVINPYRKQGIWP